MSIVLIGATAFPGAVFGNYQAKAFSPESVAGDYGNSGSNLYRFTQIKIMQPQNQPVVRLANGKHCLSGNAPADSDNLVQAPSLVNLSQPANCFSLRLGQVAPQENLQVRNLFNSAQIVIEPQPAQAFENYYAWPESGKLPVSLPAPGWAGPFFVSFWAVTVFAEAWLKAKKSLQFSKLSLSQLQVRRC